MTKLIIGLGNPGREHTRHRHNVGFMIVDRFAGRHGLVFNRRQSKAKVAEGEVDGHAIVLAKPQTYMNLSGLSVQGLVHRHRLPLSDIVVLCDDLDLPLGKIRIRPGGGSGGHKGLKSIIDSLGSQDFPRLRLGVGRPVMSATEKDVVDYVLTEFKGEERRTVNEAIDAAVEALECLLGEGLLAAMNRYNG